MAERSGSRAALAFTVALVIVDVMMLISIFAVVVYDASHPDYESLAMQSIQSSMDDRFARGARFRDDPLNGCGDAVHPCVIVRNNGGLAVSFIFAARTLHERRPQGAVIAGPCYSGCATFAALGRPHVCVTKQAAFYFHRSNLGDPQELPGDVRRWVEAHGGFPPYAEQRFTEMHYPNTLDFWSPCPPDAERSREVGKMNDFVRRHLISAPSRRR